MADDDTLEEFTLDAEERPKPKRKRKTPVPEGVPMIKPPKPKPATPEEKLAMKAAAPSTRLEGLFEIEHRKKWGFLPIIKQARDRKLLKEFAEQWGEKVTAQIIVAFFSSTDPKIRSCRFFNVPDFAYWAPYLRLSMSKNGRAVGVNDKTLSNAHEIAKAMGRGQQQQEED